MVNWWRIRVNRGGDEMRKTTFTEEQIAFALREAEAGTPVLEVCRKLGISEQTFYRWKRKFAGMGIAESTPASAQRRGCRLRLRSARAGLGLKSQANLIAVPTT
jgi:putative transposase